MSGPPAAHQSAAPARPAFKRLPRAVREQQMLDAAVTIFSRHGFHPASVDDIAALAGISKPMVYAYLGTKEELFVACLHREGTRMMSAIGASIDPDLAPDDQLWRGLRAFFGFVGAHRDGWAVLYRQARGERPFADELATLRDRIVQVVTGMLGGLLRRAAPDRAADVTETDLEVMAYALVGAAESLADWLCDHPDAEPDRMATRMMNIAWLGADRLLRGELWRPAPR
ncbi:TetR/AcrR family transcriptional regulator [Solwaraspora sp. WMMD1047]|uniref:TetR/AcrR family transcriptional regulator n=1 Tax=Solwaraspora sp. WMMD1047 TaxID=3016102 RepID=UPI002415A309|nr:TetR/AcrR family transcriptional regulator [Solwaraspora sp. WMMD1047]MDG4834507.1 TetR/AcrR family transcriptional regulator [Solwaraspora sp. WMMD1047]